MTERQNLRTSEFEPKLEFDSKLGCDVVGIQVTSDESMFDELHEECGVVAISKVTPDPAMANNLEQGLFTIQHRGQETAGIGVFDDKNNLTTVTGTGLVTKVLGGGVLETFPAGKLGIGQVRYGTVGTLSQEQKLGAAQPAIEKTAYGDIALSHNGNFTNLEAFSKKYNVVYQNYPTDSHAVLAMIAAARLTNDTLEEAVIEVLTQADGAFSLVVQGEGKMIATRDPYGFRPLMLGSYKDGGYAIASESHTFSMIGAEFKREIARGEVLTHYQDGRLESNYPFDSQPSKLCAFEYVYFSAPHGELEGRNVHMVRKLMGRQLAQEHPVEADVVIAVPDSGIPASEGYSSFSGIPTASGLIKNRYISRTFIAPTQLEREKGVQRKLNVIGPEVFNKRLVVIDDSIIRGTTMKKVVGALYAAGAKEVHLRITSAPYKWPCFFGMDTSDPNEFIANVHETVEEIGEYLGVDSLQYLSVEGLRSVLSDSAGSLCMACMDGNYPAQVPVNIRS